MNENNDSEVSNGSLPLKRKIVSEQTETQLTKVIKTSSHLNNVSNIFNPKSTLNGADEADTVVPSITSQPLIPKSTPTKPHDADSEEGIC